jgi:AcrR family transcriptional regulator
MRYEKGHKDATREHIIDVASSQFREGGLAAVGIAGIMSGAGLTNGAFYNHFESKEDLVEAVLAYALGARRAGKPAKAWRQPSATICPRAIATTWAAAARPPRWLPRSRAIQRRRAMPSPARSWKS